MKITAGFLAFSVSRSADVAVLGAGETSKEWPIVNIFYKFFQMPHEDFPGDRAKRIEGPDSLEDPDKVFP